MGAVICESPITLVTAEAITSGQAIHVDSNGLAAVSTAATSTTLGTAGSDAASGARVALHLGHGRKIRGIASAAIAAGAKITAAAGGKWVTWTAGAGVKGIAITAAAADGDFFELTIATPWTA
jgi:hypothetical protein